MSYRWGRRLVVAVAFLIALDGVGGTIAIVTGVNTFAEAWNSTARLAAPWPMMVVQVALTWVAVTRSGMVAILASVLLAIACFVSFISGFFDGAYASEELAAGHILFQVVLISWTAVVGVIAALRAREARVTPSTPQLTA